MGFYVGLFFFLYMSRASLLWGYAAPLWTPSGTLHTQISTVVFSPLSVQSNFRLPVTLLTISSSPMMASTVLEPGST